MPLKLTISPVDPPETLRSLQSQDPVQAPFPQLTATCLAPLFTLSDVVEPTKLTPESLTPVPGVPRVDG